jgi:Dimethyladenosine transferase (rRNA methylation)
MENYIQDYYENYDEDGRLFSRHGQVEFLTTMRYIEKYLSSGARVLEIGAGTGRYSHALAQKGFAVDAVELVLHNIEIFNSKTMPSEKISIRQGDARDLSGFDDDMYDLTLVLGPLYNVFTVEDKRQIIAEALRVTKPSGVVFAAYCIADASILNYGFRKGNIFSLMEPNDAFGVKMPGYKPWSAPKAVFEIVRKEDIDELMSDFAVERLHFVGVDLVMQMMRDTIDEMDDETFASYLDYHFFLCERADMAGLTCHGLDIFRKI